ncbi:GntR family transcriptional regulator [Gordonia sp. ABSL11-1]|uniref:GntR family transcriptional regulator n=1 Tax=Gordonia sp. ABSL11-1 TaxID=3053924 RepID=UPI0025734DC9|nr:GntR family transcriptional regulator [Gordonia sp. ABSL11-1]MDL9948498.1 GntR family transcriptional regulator [Gordonia sp. ABSL11-1]
MAKQTLNAVDQAYSTVRDRIVAGELCGGELLSEVEIAHELGISRTPTHEAFLRLGAEQLLTLIPRRGAVVTPVDPAEASNVLAMRQGVEGAAAAQVCAAGGPSESARVAIRDNLARQGRCVAHSDMVGFVVADDEFHAHMVAASGNPIAVHFYEQLRGRQQRLRNVLLSVNPDKLSAAYDDHTQLAQVLFDGDLSRYCDLLAAHFDRYRGAI